MTDKEMIDSLSNALYRFSSALHAAGYSYLLNDQYACAKDVTRTDEALAMIDDISQRCEVRTYVGFIKTLITARKQAADEAVNGKFYEELN